MTSANPQDKARTVCAQGWIQYMKLEVQEEQSRQRSWQGRGINDTFYFFRNEVNWNWRRWISALLAYPSLTENVFMLILNHGYNS